MIALTETQQMRLDTQLRGKRGAALASSDTTFHMYYRPPLLKSGRRLFALGWGIFIVGNLIRLVAQSAYQSPVDWLSFALGLCFVAVCWHTFRGGGELTWTAGEPRVHRKSSQDHGEPANITFETDEPQSLSIDGLQCTAHVNDIAVLRTLLAPQPGQLLGLRDDLSP